MVLVTLCVLVVPWANVPLTSMRPFVVSVVSVRLWRLSRGDVTQMTLMFGLLSSLVHELHVDGTL